MRVLIVDDEAPARERLRLQLGEIGGVEILGEAENGPQALTLVTELNPDIVLLDIRMPGIDGLQVARHLATLTEPPAVIFTTAFDEYALQAFDSHAIAYLLKPIRAEKLSAALAQAGRLTRPQLQQAAVAARFAEQRTHIAVRDRNGLRLVPVEDVLYFVADQKYTTIKHRQGEDLIDDSLKSLEEELGAAFVRIHRNTLVHSRHLERIERTADGQHFVHLRGTTERLAVSRRMAGDLKDRFRI
ncbi:MAG: response regulator transcription factor [Proteobacteria bacterium]|nr:response regulator transcription factor [Pseudomonadota bacterium]